MTRRPPPRRSPRSTRRRDLLAFKGGIMDGETLEVAQIQAIAKLPSRQVLLRPARRHRRRTDHRPRPQPWRAARRTGDRARPGAGEEGVRRAAGGEAPAAAAEPEAPEAPAEEAAPSRRPSRARRPSRSPRPRSRSPRPRPQQSRRTRRTTHLPTTRTIRALRPRAGQHAEATNRRTDTWLPAHRTGSRS